MYPASPDRETPRRGPTPNTLPSCPFLSPCPTLPDNTNTSLLTAPLLCLLLCGLLCCNRPRCCVDRPQLQYVHTQLLHLVPVPVCDVELLRSVGLFDAILSAPWPVVQVYRLSEGMPWEIMRKLFSAFLLLARVVRHSNWDGELYRRPLGQPWSPSS